MLIFGLILYKDWYQPWTSIYQELDSKAQVKEVNKWKVLQSANEDDDEEK